MPTLSGGEAQRLKLAGHLAEAATPQGTDRTLFLFDEPTTGLHFDDVAKLLRAFRQLLAAGHSLVVIEHNLDVIRAADWIIDLGPEGGDAGGEVVCAGTPREVMAHRDARTPARRCASTRHALCTPADRRRASPCRRATSATPIRIHNAREHNLKNIDVEIPRDRFTVITGVSGSGKSTLAFDILFAEGQRRYLESLNAYARQFVQPASRPDVDAIFGIPPTVAIEQRTSRGGRKSTVGDADRDLPLPAAALREARHAVLPGLRRADRAAERGRDRGAHPARLPRRRRVGPARAAGGRTARATTPTSPSGRAARATRTCASTASSCRRDRWPRLDRFQEHTIELPVADVARRARERDASCAQRSRSALEHRQGRGARARR